FAPEYNMAVNLIDRLGLHGSREILHRSFAQFQADRSVVGQARKVDEAQRALRRMDGELANAAARRGITPGDPTLGGSRGQGASDSDAYDGFLGYVQLREDIRSRERELKFVQRNADLASTTDELAALKRGHVIGLYGNRHRGIAVVIEPASNAADPKPMVLTEDGWCGRVGVRDFLNTPEVLGNMRLAKHIDRRTGRGRRDLASALRSTGIDLPRGRQRKRSEAADDRELASLRAQLRAHPAHKLDNSDELFRLAERRNRLVRDIATLDASIAARTSTLRVTFDRVVGVLTDLGYLQKVGAGAEVTDPGRILGRIYSESDLLVSECLREGIWDDLPPHELAAVVAALVFEARRDTYSGVDAMPGSAGLRAALADTVRIWQDITEVESRHRLTPTREPDTGFSVAVALWASGRSLTEALVAAGDRGNLLSPGDFVRWNRQVVDLLEQVAKSVDSKTRLAATARSAIGAIRRGIVAVELK
ncbi:putative helicase, partial [Gordonia effusa NBRC 100432]